MSIAVLVVETASAKPWMTVVRRSRTVIMVVNVGTSIVGVVGGAEVLSTDVERLGGIGEVKKNIYGV